MRIPVAEPYIGKKEVDYVNQALNSGWISSKGGFVARFEEEFANYCGVKYGIATSSGTSALHLALVAVGIGQGDEVILPALTFAATAFAVSYTGAIPVFADIDEYHWGIDLREAARKINEKTAAMIPVHLYGHPCRIPMVDDRARKIWVIEDAAEAHGAELAGRKVGSWGDIGCFSFYGNKLITTGEGGMCVTNNEGMAAKMRYLKNHAMLSGHRYWHEEIGYNYNITNLQAAFGLAQLEQLDKFIEKKREIARWYEEGLVGLANEGVLTLHPNTGWAKCVYWMYSIRVKHNKRDDLSAFLASKGIETRPFFGVIPYMPPYLGNENFFVAERVSNEGLNLPTSVNLTKEKVDYVVNQIKEWRRGRL